VIFLYEQEVLQQKTCTTQRSDPIIQSIWEYMEDTETTEAKPKKFIEWQLLQP